MPPFLWRRKKIKAKATPPPNSSEPHSAASVDDLRSQSPSHAQNFYSAATVSTSHFPAEDQPQDLWDRAYKLLREDESNRKVLESYEMILLSELRDADSSQAISFSLAGLDRECQLSALITKKIQIMDDARWKFKVGNQTVEVRAQVDRVVKAVLFAKDFVSTALLLNPSGQHKALAQGLDQISDIICRYTVIEEIYHTQTAETSATSFSAHSRKLDHSLETHITKLYSQIIQYQVRVVCQLLRPAVVQFGRDVLMVDDWATLLLEIKETDLICKGFFSVIDSQRLQHGFNEQARRREQLYLKLQSNLELLLQTTENVAKDVKDNWQEQKNFRRSDEESSFLQALYNSKYEEHKSRNLDRGPGTCQWFLRNEKYCTWMENKSSDLLWVTANPGCGKSVLSKTLIDNELRNSPSSTTCYFFFKDDSADQRSVTKAICALLHQILHAYEKPVLLQKGVDVFRSHGAKMLDSFSILWDLLLDIAQDPEASKILCILDALDECEERGRNILIKSINKFHSSVGGNKYNGRLKFLITSRPYDDIEQQFDNSIIRLAAEDATDLIKQEIDLVIKDRVPQLATKLKLDPATELILQQRLLDTENRTYLWLHLILEDVIKRSLRVKTPKRMKQFLEEIPATVYDAYDHILKRSPEPDDARKLLNIVLAAERPLTLREMNLALNIEDGQRSREEVDLIAEDTFPSYIKNICGLFVNIIDSRIYFLHQTAKEFLVSREDVLQCVSHVMVHQETWKHSMDLGSSNLVLATICLQYLSFTVFEDDPLYLYKDHIEEEETGDRIIASEEEEEDDDDEEGYEKPIRQIDEMNEDVDSALYQRQSPGDELIRYCEAHEFLDYASIYWESHFRIAREDHRTSKLWIGAGNTQSKRFRTWFALYWGVNDTFSFMDEYHAPTYFTSLTLASFFGHDTIVKQLLEEGQTDSTNNFRRTSLWWAARKGYHSTLKILFEKGHVQSEDYKGRTPLAEAASRGHEEIAKLLIDNGATICSTDDKGSTPLHEAASNGHVETMQLLMEKGAAIDSTDDRGRTALHSAVNGRHNLKAVELLVMKGGADPDILTEDGETPLAMAAIMGKPDIVQFLLAHGAHPNLKCSYNPLAITASMGYAEVVRALIAYGADPNIKTRDGVTPLQHAEEDHAEHCGERPCGHEAIIKLLKPITVVPVQSPVEENEECECGSNDMEDNGVTSGA